MKEPSLLDVFNAVVTPRRVWRGLLMAAALYLTYLGVTGLLGAQSLAWGAVLQILAAIVLSVIAWNLAEARSISAALSAAIPRWADVVYPLRGARAL